MFKIIGFFKKITIFFLIFIWVFIYSPEIPVKIFLVQALEVLDNPGFDGGTAGWTLSTIFYDDSVYYGSDPGSIKIEAGRNQNVSGTATHNNYNYFSSDYKVFLNGFYRVQRAGNGTAELFIEIAEENNPNSWITIYSNEFSGNNLSIDWTAISGAEMGLDVSSYFNADGNYRLRVRIIASGGAAGNSAENIWVDELSLNLIHTILGPGASEPDSVTIGPGYPATDLSFFTLKTEYDSDTMTSAVVELNPANSYENIAEVFITDMDNNNQCDPVINPSSNVINFSNCDLSINDTETNYKIRIKPKSHLDMPSPPGSSYNITGVLSSFVSTNPQSGEDSGSAVVTIDNLSPNNASNTSGEAQNRAVTLNWTSSSGENSTTTILRWEGDTPGEEKPVEGLSYNPGDIIGDAIVACLVANQASESELSRTDGLNGSSPDCSTEALINGDSYSYRIFQSDEFNNYSTGLTFSNSPFTPIMEGIHISLNTDGNINFGVMPLGKSQDNIASPEVILVEGDPVNLDIKSTNFVYNAETWYLGEDISNNVVKWEFSLDSNNWTIFSEDNVNYVFDTNVPSEETRNIYLRITTPVDSATNGPYGSVVTLMASAP